MWSVGWNCIHKRKVIWGEFREVELRWVSRSYRALGKWVPLKGHNLFKF